MCMYVEHYNMKSDGGCPLDEIGPGSLFTKESTDFFDEEVKLMQALFSGEGIDHHMEMNCEQNPKANASFDFSATTAVPAATVKHAYDSKHSSIFFLS